MARYEEIIENPQTWEQFLIKSNDYYSFIEKKNKRIEKINNDNITINSKEESENKTNIRTKIIDENNNILNYTLSVNDVLDWDKLKINSIFNEKEPSMPDKTFIEEKIKKEYSIFSFFVKNKIIEKSNIEFDKQLQIYNENKKLFEINKSDFEKNKTEHNEKISKIKNNYENNLENWVFDYISLVLEQSKYPEEINLNEEIYYDKNSKVIIVDMDIPSYDSISNVTWYKYSKTKWIEPTLMKKTEHEKYYNNIIYQICLRTIHEIFESDYLNHIDIVVFNWWVNWVDKKTWNDVRNCIITLQTTKEEFNKINLSKVDVIECFRWLKWVTAGSFVNLSPVRPLMQIDYNDKRIIQSDEVIDDIWDLNLAKMDWQDFETLIRDLFSKMFSWDWCKVEVTQASRDAWVDAIIFDNDPIRWWKYVIQAKRYNNIVPLTAVRDLYWTMMNEWAVKWILVTTSYFWKDSLEFVKDKPIKLINWEELLYWFNKNWYNMKIELENKKKSNSHKNY